MLSSLVLSAALLVTQPDHAYVAVESAPAVSEGDPDSDRKRIIAPRAQRKSALTAEIGLRTLGLWGLVYTYHVTPHVSLDVGGGFGAGGQKIKFGSRVRYNFLPGRFTPFVGLGLTISPGGEYRWVEPPVMFFGMPLGAPRERVTVWNTTPALQGVAGISWQSYGGFVLQGSLGYSQNLVPSHRIRHPQFLDNLSGDVLELGSGAAISVATGYAF